MSDSPNPFVEPGPFGTIAIGDKIVETTLVSIDGATKPEEWQNQMGTGTGGATSVWRGTKLAESLKLVFRATDEVTYNAQGDLYNTVRPKLGQKPPTLVVTNPTINWGGISRIVLKTPAFPKWDPKGAWDFEWEFQEYAPSKKTDVGPADPAKGKFVELPQGDAADKELDGLVKAAKAL